MPDIFAHNFNINLDRKNNKVNFKLTKVDDVLDYIKNYVTESDDPERRKNAKKLLKDLERGTYKAFHAFVNEYQERYLVVGCDLDKWVWLGDESDWQMASSYYEDHFVAELLQTARAEIIKIEK